MSKEQELKREWVGFALRMQGMARSQAGYAVLSLKVLVDPNGCPVAWAEPDMTRIEPLSGREWMRMILTMGKE